MGVLIFILHYVLFDMMKFLVKYGIHAKGISVEETELTKVKDIIKE
jgi:hypothetical protein